MRSVGPGTRLAALSFTVGVVETPLVPGEGALFVALCVAVHPAHAIRAQRIMMGTRILDCISEHTSGYDMIFVLYG
jgi:inosine/xanthosine triphosphate pyrophosphatase family protein